MEDDMLFCQKCGTKFEEVAIDRNDIKVKIAKMKKYNLVINATSMPWEYVKEDFERTGNILVKQNNMCHELQELIVDILNSADEENRNLVERDVYTYILNMCRRMCEEGAKMFANRSGYKELFDQGNSLVIAGKLSPNQFMECVYQVDIPYKKISGVQGLNAYELKEKLSEDVIYNNLEFRELTRKFAQAYNDMMLQEIKRHTDFFLGPSIEHINMMWDMYVTILKGLPQSTVDKLDERCWIFILDNQERNYNGAQYKREFLKKRDYQRNVQRKKEQEIENKKYWESHPEEYRQMEINRTKLSELSSNIVTINKEICSMGNIIYSLNEKKVNIEAKISDKKQKIEKLGKKILGKKKAEEEIQVLNDEVVKLNQELQSVFYEINAAEKPIMDKKLERSNLEKEIRQLEQENVNLRNK